MADPNPSSLLSCELNMLNVCSIYLVPWAKRKCLNQPVALSWSPSLASGWFLFPSSPLSGWLQLVVDIMDMMLNHVWDGWVLTKRHLNKQAWSLFFLTQILGPGTGPGVLLHSLKSSRWEPTHPHPSLFSPPPFHLHPSYYQPYPYFIRNWDLISYWFIYSQDSLRNRGLYWLN